jgi:hypothetical protein
VLWWTDTAKLGWMLSASVPLWVIAIMIETARQRPLLQLSWLGSLDILRFAAVALLVRLALAELFGIIPVTARAARGFATTVRRCRFC